MTDEPDNKIVTKSGITSEKLTIPAQPQTLPGLPVGEGPNTDTSLGWLPDTFVKAWLTKHADEYKMHAESDFDNGRSVALLMHPKSVIDPMRMESEMYKHALKKPGQYFQRLHGMRLLDVPVFIVFMTKDRKAPPKVGA